MTESKKILDRTDIEAECRRLLNEEKNFVLYGPSARSKTRLIKKLKWEYEQKDVIIVRLEGDVMDVIEKAWKVAMWSMFTYIFLIETNVEEHAKHWEDSGFFEIVKHR